MLRNPLAVASKVGLGNLKPGVRPFNSRLTPMPPAWLLGSTTPTPSVWLLPSGPILALVLIGVIVSVPPASAPSPVGRVVTDQSAIFLLLNS